MYLCVSGTSVCVHIVLQCVGGRERGERMGRERERREDGEVGDVRVYHML